MRGGKTRPEPGKQALLLIEASYRCHRHAVLAKLLLVQPERSLVGVLATQRVLMPPAHLRSYEPVCSSSCGGIHMVCIYTLYHVVYTYAN